MPLISFPTSVGRFLRRKHLLTVFVGMALFMILSAVIELRQSKKELLDLMKADAHTISETVLIASTNILNTNFIMEDILNERLLNNAGFIRYLYETGRLNNRLLARFARENRIYRINIFDKKGRKRFFSHPPEHGDLPERFSPDSLLDPIFSGQQDTLIIGLRSARYQSGIRYVVALAARDRSAIVVNLDAKKLLELRREIGFGSLIRGLEQNHGIVYAALQDTAGILAASGNITELQSIKGSPFLQQALLDSVFRTRVVPFKGQNVLETVHPFYYNGHPVGIFRLGLSLAPLQAINQRIYRRMIFISLLLLIIGFILFTLFIIRQNLDMLNRQYQVVETYSRNVVEHVSDAIIVTGPDLKIQTFNKAAEELFRKPADLVLGNDLRVLFTPGDCKELYQSHPGMREMRCEVSGRKRDLFISQSRYRNAAGEEMMILVIRDLTEFKRLEAQIQRRERLTAMGQLASGVAHEIRNPLNAIGTVVQQLDRDFEVREGSEDYHKLARLVYQEVKRIDKTIADFLRFARPEPLRPETFPVRELFDQLRAQFQPLFEAQNIRLIMDVKWQGEVHWDRHKIYQVLINLIKNSQEALSDGGEMTVSLQKLSERELEIVVMDNGPGIPKDMLSKIFNLYFTTKARGTGVGLAIVQRIIDQHGGTISVESREGEGTTFIIRLPVKTEE